MNDPLKEICDTYMEEVKGEHGLLILNPMLDSLSKGINMGKGKTYIHTSIISTGANQPFNVPIL
jgi:hypothetical protein